MPIRGPDCLPFDSRDNVIACSDCGFGTWVGQAAVVVWAKLAAMAEGARLATKQFGAIEAAWNRPPPTGDAW
jgi:hypothetical protein